MDVLITGCDTDLGRTIAQAFNEAGHTVFVAGRRRDDLEVTAKELDSEALVVDTTDPSSVAELHTRVPAHLDTLIHVPAPRRTPGDPRTYDLADHAAEWRDSFDATLVSTVLTLGVLGDHLRAGGSVVTVLPEPPQSGTAAAAVKAAVADWTAGRAEQFGIRGITVNAVAVGRSAEPGYAGLTGAGTPVGSEISRLALFLTTPAARHITGQTLHVSHGALVDFG